MGTRRSVALALVLSVLVVACGRDTGPEAAPGFDGDTITLGLLTPLQGPVAVAARPLTVGNEIFFEWLNDEKGGIAGRYKVQLLAEDTSYDAATAVTKYHKLKDRVALFAQVYGTPIVNAVVPLFAADGLVGSPASLDAAWVANPNLLPVGAPYQVQFANAADHYVNQAGGRGSTICFAGMAGSYGDAGLDGLRFAAGVLGFPVATAARYNRGDNDFTAPLSQLRSAGCQAVFLNALPTDTARLLSQGAQLGFTPRWIAQSPSWSADLARSEAIGVLESHLWVVNEGAEWGDRSIRGEADFLDRLARYRPEQAPDHTVTFGYLQAWAVAQVLERAVAAGDLSRAGVARALREAGTLRFDGLSGDYAYGPPERRVAPRESTLFKVNRSKPLGLEALRTNFETDTARRLTFA